MMISPLQRSPFSIDDAKCERDAIMQRGRRMQHRGKLQRRKQIKATARMLIAALYHRTNEEGGVEALLVGRGRPNHSRMIHTAYHSPRLLLACCTACADYF